MEKECKHCNQVIQYDKPQQLGAHIVNCSFNPKRADITKKSTLHRLESAREKNPMLHLKLICGYCGKEYQIDVVKSYYERGNYIKYCSKECAHSQSATCYINESKTDYCKGCGKEIVVKRRTHLGISNCVDCTDKFNKCRKSYKSIEYNNGAITCKICGQTECEYPDICRNLSHNNSAFFRLGINIVDFGTKEIYIKFFDCIDNLKHLYHSEELPLTEIGVKYNLNFQTLSSIFKRWGLLTREVGEQQFISLKNGRRTIPANYMYKKGWHTTWNGKNAYYRSSYELEYYQKLDEEHIDYDVENLRIIYYDTQLKRRRVAIPDINTPHNNQLIEIKSTWTYNKINMRDKIKAYKKLGYSVKLVIGSGKKTLMEKYEEEYF